MSEGAREGLTDDQLGERLRSLRRDYDVACLAHNSDEAQRLHRELRAVESEIRDRRGGGWGRTGLEEQTVEQLVERFKALAIEHDEAEDMPESERLYWEKDKVETELERRSGDQRRALIPLYVHPDVRIQAAAADATRTLAAALSRSRLLAIDDPEWFPPISTEGMSERDLDAWFPGRKKDGPPWRSKLKDLTVDQLVDRFQAIALDQDEALLIDAIPRFNRLFMQMQAVDEELKSRDGDQRRALSRLHKHKNAQVRLAAAKATLAVLPEASRKVLRAIAKSGEMPQAGDAGMSLRNLDRGVFKPT